MKSILHITPSLPPSINGVGDFSKILVENFKKIGLRENSFLVYNFTKENINAELEEPIIQLDKSNLYKQLSLLLPDVIILHYVGYAYQQKGLPFYIVSAIKKYKNNSNGKFLVFYHELHSSSNNPFKSPFYTNFLQRKIVKQLYINAEMTFINSELYQKILCKSVEDNNFKNICTGLYSNIPDNLFDSTIQKNSIEMVVFGTFSRRASIYQKVSFVQLIEKLQIKIINDIGPGQITFEHPTIKVFARGSLSPTNTALFLNKATFGAIDYPPALLGKSGIFSAYCAFGVIAFNTDTRSSTLYDKLVEGRNYFNSSSNFINTASNRQIAKEEILRWYSLRNQQVVSETIIKYI